MHDATCQRIREVADAHALPLPDALRPESIPGPKHMYHVNFSVFRSTVDVWGISQVNLCASTMLFVPKCQRGGRGVHLGARRRLLYGAAALRRRGEEVGVVDKAICPPPSGALRATLHVPTPLGGAVPSPASARKTNPKQPIC